MSAADADWHRRYRAALAAFMQPDGSDAASDPLALGRAALAAGLGPIDLLAAHEFVLTGLIAATPPEAIADAMIRAHAFMTEAFAPFEMTHRGWHEVVDRLRGINEALEARVVERTAALRESEERFRSIFAAVNEGIFIASAMGKFTQVNAAGYAMFGYGPDELIGADIEQISSGVPPYTQREALEWNRKAAATRRPQRFDWHCKAKDGRLFWAEVAIQFALISGDDVVLALVREVTEQRAVEAQLRQAQKMEAIGNLTGGLAHDFNNLLGVVIGNLDLAREQMTGELPVIEMVDEALEAAWRGADLTRRLLAFARRQPLQAVVIDLNELVANTVRLLRRVLGEHIEVTLDLTDGVWPVSADPAQLEAALANLATNARDAMAQGGRLSIRTGNATLDTDYAASHSDVAPGDFAMVEVNDTGVGMPPDIAARIFEPFFTTKPAGAGTGLGLSMVFGFMRQSGGHINVYSEPGFGTSFRLYLPRAHDKVADREALAAPEARGSGECILLVEDNAPMRRIALRQLRELGYRALEAERAAEAIGILQHAPVDLLLTDIVMPGGLDGVELARLARERWPRLKIILTSGFPDVRTNAAAAMPTDLRLLNKPYSKDALARVLRDALTSAG
jgi:PAS domain S-box-containing protein